MATGAAMNLGVGLAFEGQPGLLRMIKIAQKASRPGECSARAVQGATVRPSGRSSWRQRVARDAQAFRDQDWYHQDRSRDSTHHNVNLHLVLLLSYFFINIAIISIITIIDKIFLHDF